MKKFSHLFKKSQENNKQTIHVFSPVYGNYRDLIEVPDEVFSSGMMGKGFAVKPEEDIIYAPVDGVITMLFPTLHALGIKMKNGAELLIHVGINTVDLDGKGFSAYIQAEQTIHQGDKLLKFNRKWLSSEGYDNSIIVIVTNSDLFTITNKNNTHHLSLRPTDEILEISASNDK